MICKACQAGAHGNCELGCCECPSRKEEEAIDRSITANRQDDEELAEMILSNLLAVGSELGQMITNGAGRDNVKLFIQQVLRGYKAIKC